MKKRPSLSAAFTLLVLLMLLALPACDGGTPPTAALAPTQGTATTQQLQATIEALQTKVVEQDANAPAPTPQVTTVIASEATSEPTAEGTQEPEATEVPVLHQQKKQRKCLLLHQQKRLPMQLKQAKRQLLLRFPKGRRYSLPGIPAFW